MRIQKIYSENDAWQLLEAVKNNRNKRHKQGVFFVEGVRNINAAVKFGWGVRSLIYARGAALSDWAEGVTAETPTEVNYELPPELMARLSGKDSPSELLALVEMRESGKIEPLSDNPVLTLFDRPSNKGNLGAILRSCDALGVEGIAITGHAIDIYDSEVVAASMGSFFKVPFTALASNEEIDGFIANFRAAYPSLKVVGTSERAEVSIYEANLAPPLLLLIGNEADGLNRRLREVCDFMAAIPMVPDSYASSLNVSCAASILFAEAGRRRG